MSPKGNNKVKKEVNGKNEHSEGNDKKKEKTLEQFKGDNKTAYNEIKKTIIECKDSKKETDISKNYRQSKYLLDNYVTLDWEHIDEILEIMSAILEYKNDDSKKRPLNIIMIADPGSGKSHFIECLVEKLDEARIEMVSYSLANLESINDLKYTIQNVKMINGKKRLPLLFIDEFDSFPKKNYPLLLPLLWDGVLHMNDGQLKIGKTVIMLAGSRDRVKQVLGKVASMKRISSQGDEDGKLFDLISRINGGDITIPSLDLRQKDLDRDRRIDKVCIAISLLLKRFPDLETVPWGLLHFIAIKKFRYGVRSIWNIIDLIPKDAIENDNNTTTLSRDKLKSILRKKSPFFYHIMADEDADVIVSDRADAIVSDWKDYIGENGLVTISGNKVDKTEHSMFSTLKVWAEDKNIKDENKDIDYITSLVD